MRTHSLFVAGFLAGLLGAATIAPTAAQAQFPLDPRALLGRMTAPLRQMLPHPSYRQRAIHRGPARDAGAQRETPDQDTSRLGIVGPPVWPSAYQDLIGYTFWPNEYAAAYRQHGFGDIATAILTPMTNAPPAAEARRRPAETTGDASTDASSAQPCDEQTVQTDWPTSQVEQTIQLNATQRNALDRLQSTINDASKSIRAGACRDTDPLPPTERLGAMVQRLWAVQNAGVVIRGALKDFYDTLTDEQKAKFQTASQANPPGDSRNTGNPMGRQQACTQGADDDRLIKQIQQTVRPTPRQRPSIEMLGKTAGGMEQYLMASCAQPTPGDPLARLDAANNRLTAINYAATSMEVALNQFRAALSVDQRKKFDTLSGR